MSNTKTISLDDAVAAARRLPADTQAELAVKLMERVEDVSTPDRPRDRQDLIKRRLAEPLSAVSRDEFMAVLRRYHPAL